MGEGVSKIRENCRPLLWMVHITKLEVVKGSILTICAFYSQAVVIIQLIIFFVLMTCAGLISVQNHCLKPDLW